MCHSIEPTNVAKLYNIIHVHFPTIYLIFLNIKKKSVPISFSQQTLCSSWQCNQTQKSRTKNN